MLALLPLLLYGSAPSWWTQRGVLVDDAVADDYAPANQGQLKQIATAAVAEMDAKLSGGAGDALHSLINTWSVAATDTNDFAPVNLGQLKNVARPFYDRLIAAGLVNFYPWLGSSNDADDFAVANIGQVKNLFSFEIPTSNSLDDSTQDRLAAGVRSGNLALQANAVWFWATPFATATIAERTFPRPLSGLSGIKSVSGSDQHFVALRTDGAVLTWGKNDRGQLGDGTNIDRSSPGIVPNLSSILSVKAGDAHTLALRADGIVMAWGDNFFGQLGTGDNLPSPQPVEIVGLTDVRKLAAGTRRSMALKSDGTVWTWGYDRSTPGNTPLQVSDLTEIVDIAAGYDHAVVVKADGTVWAWGANYENQIGNGNPWWIIQKVPAQVPNLANVAKVAASYNHNLALLNDGTVWAWGSNSSGQLGDDTSQPRQNPVPVTSLTNVIAIAAGSGYSLALKSDGTVWTWGDGSSGTVPGVDLHLPQQVGFGLFDTNHNGMDDRWEAQYFQTLSEAPDADFDGDGISNLQEFFRGTNPSDYFNGVAPVIEIVGGNNQVGDAGSVLPRPIVVRVKNSSGQVLARAPLRFSVSSGSGLLGTSATNAAQTQLGIRADATGQAAAYVMLPSEPGTSAHISVSPESAAALGAVSIRATARFVPPPTPAPTPDPSATPDPSPSPTPSPTATPPAPYRYAILDLGRDLFPIRINNNGWVLLFGRDASGSWGYYRWKGGALERLLYSDPSVWFVATDINDAGVVVGRIDETATELSAGIIWRPDSSMGQKVSGGSVPDGTSSSPGQIRLASFSAVTTAGDIYGQTATGGRYFGLEGGVWFQDGIIQNAGRWSTDGTSFQLISNAHPIQVAGGNTNWAGQMDTISRANARGNYIGSSLIASGETVRFLGFQATVCASASVVNGVPVSFEPVDLNNDGVVVGSAGADMVVSSPPSPQTTISGASPLAINTHTRPAPSPGPPPIASPAPTPIPIPQVLGWAGNALVIWERQEDGTTWHPFGLEEMIPSMDGWEYLGPTDMNDSGAIAGSAWYSDPSNPQAQGENHAFLLIPVELVNAPLVKDESGDDIPDSDKPKSTNDANETVKEPRAGQIPNVAYRVLKVRVPDLMEGERVRWSMTPQFTPEGKSGPEFRGQWPPEHPDRFEPDNTENYYLFQRISQAEGWTTIDNTGETAVRINIPPIGFNKARVRMEFERYPATFVEVDFEVPAIVVIDPGHGGTGRLTDPDGGFSDGEHAIGPLSQIQEKAIALSYALELRETLKSLVIERLINLKVYLTRETDINLGPRARTNKARDNGADVLLSIHLNGSDNHNVRGTETWIRRPSENRNYAEDFVYAERIQSAVFGAIHDYDPSTINNRGIKDGGLVMTSDDQLHLGNTDDFHPTRAALVEIEFLDNPVVDQFLNMTSNRQAIQTHIVDRLSTAIIEDLKRQPSQQQ